MFLAALAWLLLDGGGSAYEEAEPLLDTPSSKTDNHATRGSEEPAALNPLEFPDQGIGSVGVLPPDSPYRNGLAPEHALVRGRVVADEWIVWPSEVQIELVSQIEGQWPTRHTTATRQDPNFKFERVPFGNWKIRLHAPGFESLFQLLTLEARIPDQHVILQLRSSNQILGRVLDANGQPMTGMMVTARPRLDDPSKAALPIKALSEAEGRFSIKNVRPGTYWVHAGPPSSPLGEIQEIYLGGSEAYVDLIMPAVGHARVDVREKLSRKPLQGIKVIAQLLARNKRSHQETVLTAQDGRAVFPHLPPGEYTFTVFGSGYHRDVARAQVNLNGAATVEFELRKINESQ